MNDLLPLIVAGDLGYVPINNSPDIKVEVAWNSGFTTPAADRVWTDVSTYVDLDRSAVSLERGRPDQHSQVQPSRLSLTLDNRDGRFTPEYAAGAYYPNVKRGRPVRVSATSVLGTAFILFTGYIDVWPVQWPGGSDAYSSVTINATSRMARLGKGATFRSIIEEEYLYDGPVLYFPLGEPSGSTTAGNIAPGRSEVLTATQVGSGGTLEFGAGTGPSTDDLTAPIFTPVSAGNGQYLATALITPVNVAGDTVIDMEGFVATTVSGVKQNVLALSVPGTAIEWSFTSTGLPAVSLVVDGAGGTSVTSTHAVNDGATHHISTRVTLSGGNATASIVVDGNARESDATPGTFAAFPQFTQLTVGTVANVTETLFTGTISHVAVSSGTAAIDLTRIQAHHSAGIDGFEGESSDARVDRYARLAGIPATEISTETGLTTSMAHKDTTGQLPISLMQDVATTEDGLVFDGRDGTLTFQSRPHRYNSTSAFTLSCAAQEVEANLSPVLDDQGMVNDLTASRPKGVTVKKTNEASIDENGFYRETLEILTTDDNEVQSRADWAVNRFGTPRVKLTQITVNLTASTPAQQDALLAADIGTRFTVSNLPAQAPASSMDFFVEGITYDIGPEFFTISFSTTAAGNESVWVLDSTTYSVLDSTTVLAY